MEYLLGFGCVALLYFTNSIGQYKETIHLTVSVT